MQRAVANLIKDLKTETMLRREKKKKDENMEKIEAGLSSARALIRETLLINGTNESPYEDADYVPQGNIYRNPHAFHRYAYIYIYTHTIHSMCFMCLNLIELV